MLTEVEQIFVSLCRYKTIKAYRTTKAMWEVKVKIIDMKRISKANWSFRHQWVSEHPIPNESGVGEPSLHWYPRTYYKLDHSNVEKVEKKPYLENKEAKISGSVEGVVKVVEKRIGVTLVKSRKRKALNLDTE